MQKPRLEVGTVVGARVCGAVAAALAALTRTNAALTRTALLRLLLLAAAHPLVTSAAGVVLLLVAILTDLAAHAGSLAFLVLCVLYWCRPRPPARPVGSEI